MWAIGREENQHLYTRLTASHWRLVRVIDKQQSRNVAKVHEKYTTEA